MSTDQKLRQLINRLQNSSTSAERVEALYDLQGLARSNPADVGNQGLSLILEMLKDQGSVEEYQECLELISRLLKTNIDGEAAVSNASAIVAETGNVEIFLDLLDHEDGLIGIMASDLLRDIHSLVPEQLETAIHECPAGMNKLLHRVADRTREEVGNQALVLIQQLTLTNEEMKKTVAFNEGFDILFNIIVQEGGVLDPSVVVEDCLRVCCNILDDSEICQRLFYSMGASWRHTLVGFFDPEQLEKRTKSFLEDEDEPAVSWFDQPTRHTCAVLAMTALINSLGALHPEKHQFILAKEFEGVIVTSAMFWCARNGPVDLIPLALTLLKAIIIGNPETLERVKAAYLIVKPPKKGLHVPHNYETAPLTFGNKLPGSEDRVAISIPSLLAERYLMNDSALLWSNTMREQDTHTPIYGVNYAPNYLEALDVFLSVDPTSAGMILQHVLAPMPPSPDDDAFGDIDTGKPFGSVVLRILIESCNRVLQHLNNTALTVTPSAADISSAQKCANLFTLILIHGGALARELASAVHLSHIVGASLGENVAFLPFILSVLARVVRMPHGHSLSVSLLRLLCAAGAACETSCRLMLENPSNLFVVDLAVLATGEESSSVLYDVHSYSCFFLGTCLQSLPDTQSVAEGAMRRDEGEQVFHVSRKMLLDVIDSKIGLTRFTDVLKRRVNMESKLLAQNVNGDNNKHHALELLRSATFLAFMNSQREAIRKAIYDHYSGALPNSGGGNSAESSALAKIVELQKEEIARLTAQIGASNDGNSSTASSRESTEHLASLEGVIVELKAELTEKMASCDRLKSELVDAAESIISLNAANDTLKLQNMELREATSGQEQSSQSLIFERTELLNKLNVAEQQISVLEMEINAVKQKSLSDAASLMEKDDIISNLKDDLTDANKSWSHKLSIEEAKIRNLQAEIKDLDKRVSIPAEISPLAVDDQCSGLVIELKEQIISLNNDKKKMKEDLDKANRSIKLMEEELKGPIPFEKNRESKIADLESRNSELKKQIWQLEGELEGSKTAAFDGCYNIIEAMKPMVRAVVDSLDDSRLLTIDLDPNRRNSTVGVEALTAFIASDILTCRDLVEQSLISVMEHGNTAGVFSSTSAEIATLAGLTSWISMIIDCAAAHVNTDAEPVVAPSVTAEIIESLQNEVDEALQSKQDLMDRCGALHEEFLKLKAANDVLRSANASLEDANSEISSRNGTLEAEVAQLQEKVRSLHSSNSSLSTANEIEAATAHLVQELEDMKMQKFSLECNFQIARDAIVTILSCLDKSAETSETIESLTQVLKAEVESIIQFKHSAEAVSKKLNNDIVRYQQNAIIHEDELEELRRQCSDFYERTHEHDELLFKFEQMVNDFSVAEEKIAKFNDIVDKLTSDNRSLANEKERYASIVKEMESKHLNEVRTLNMQIEGLPRLADEVDRLKDVITAKNEKIAEIETSRQSAANINRLQIIELEEKLMLAESEKRDIENRNLSEKEPLAKVVASLRGERDYLKKELQTRDVEVKETASECASLAGRVAGFTAAFEGLQEEFENVREEKDALDKEYYMASQKITELSNSNFLLEANLASKTTEIEELKAFLIFREKELERKHRISVAESFSHTRELILNQMDQQFLVMSRDIEQNLYAKNAQVDAMQSSLGGPVRNIIKKMKILSQAKSDLQKKIAQSEQQVVVKEQHIEFLKKTQNDILKAAKEVLLWASSCCSDVLSTSGVAAAPPFSNFETIPESLLYLRDQVDATIDALQKANKELKREVREHHESLVAAQKKQARLEAELLEQKFHAPSSNGHGLSTPQHPSRQAKVNFQNTTTPGPTEKALALSGRNNSHVDIIATTPASVSRTQHSPSTKELSKLQSELRKERKRLHVLREQHEELLGLLAQQELEMKTFREKLFENCGQEVVTQTEEEIRREAVDRYGSYIDFRQDEGSTCYEYGAIQSPLPLPHGLASPPQVV